MRGRRVATAALLAILVSGAGLPGSPAGGTCSAPRYDDKCERSALWFRTGVSAIWSPQYSRPTGTLVVAGSHHDTIYARGFDARSGDRRWSYAFDDREHVSGIGKDVAVSHDGRIAFVTGLSRTEETHYDWVTFAVAARTGRLLWKRRFGGSGPDVPWQVVADPRRDAAYVAGEITKHGGGQAVVAYDAETGRRLWKRERGDERYDYSIDEIRLRGSDLYVLESRSCYTEGCTGGPLLTRGIPSRSGFDRIWTARLDDGVDYIPGSLEASARQAFVVGVQSRDGVEEFVVQAFRRRSGALAWTARFETGGGFPVNSPIVGMDEFRHQLIVGESFSYGRPLIAAFDERTGQLRWTTRFTRDAPHEAALGDVGADRRAVYATGSVRDAAHDAAVTTVALAPDSGRQRWIARYQPPGAEFALGYLRFRRGRLVVVFDGAYARNSGAGLVTYRLRN